MGIAMRPTKIVLSLVCIGQGMCLFLCSASDSKTEKIWLDRLHLWNYSEPFLYTFWLKTGSYPDQRKISHLTGYHVKTFYNHPYGLIQKANLVNKKGKLAFCFSPRTKGLYIAFLIMERIKNKTREIFISKQEWNGDQFWYGKTWKGMDKKKLNVSRLTQQVPFELTLKYRKIDMQYIQPLGSGDFVTFTAYLHGEPQEGVPVTITAKEGWSKTVITDSDGRASFQLIRDSYKRKLSALQISDFLVEATIIIPEKGETIDCSYSQTRYCINWLIITFTPPLEISPSLPALPLFFLTLVTVGIGIFICRLLTRK